MFISDDELVTGYKFQVTGNTIVNYPWKLYPGTCNCLLDFGACKKKRNPTSNSAGLPLLADFLNYNYKFPLDSCSRSMASNRALKFPLPKLLAPLR
jgi:hypothetical protein